MREREKVLWKAYWSCSSAKEVVTVAVEVLVAVSCSSVLGLLLFGAFAFSPFSLFLFSSSSLRTVVRCPLVNSS